MDPMNIMPQKKSHAELITIIVVVVIIASVGFYFWETLPRQSSAIPPANTVVPLPQVQALLNGTTTAEQDLSTDVLNGTNVDLTSGISQ